MSNTTSPLEERECRPCQGGTPPLALEEIREFLPQLQGGWQVSGSRRLEKNFKFRNFRAALDFTIRIGELAEKAGHHPEIVLTWGKVGVRLWTHKVGGLSEADFILAARIDRLPLQ